MRIAESSSLSTDKSKPRILLVFGRYSSSFLAYPWIFAQTGKVIVDTIFPQKHLIQHSVWVNQHIDVREDDDFLDQLCATIDGSNYDEMFCIDEYARELVLKGGERKELQPYLPFSSAPHLREVAINKTKFHDWCTSLNLQIAFSVTCRGTEAILAATERFDYPFILKTAAGAGGQNVFLVHTHEDIDDALSTELEGTEWVIQEYLDGAVGTTIFMAREGRLHAHCHYGNISCTDSGTGPAAVCEHVVSDELDRIVEKVAAVVDGLTGFDWIQRNDGTYALIDPHFGRTAPTGACAHLFGVDFGAAYCESISNETHPSHYNKQCSVVWVFPQILQLILEGGFFRAWRATRKSKGTVKPFLYAPGEWRMFLLQFFDYVRGSTIVFLGGIRRKLFK